MFPFGDLESTSAQFVLDSGGILREHKQCWRAQTNIFLQFVRNGKMSISRAHPARVIIETLLSASLVHLSPPVLFTVH